MIFEAPVPSLGYATFYLVEGKNKTATSLKASATVTLVESGPVCATVRAEGSILNSERVQEITLYASLPRIDLKTVLDWDGQEKIQVNTTFPFKIDHGRLTYEVPFGMVEYGKESPSSKACHPTVRATNNWMDISNDSMGITLATEVTPFDVKDRLDPRFHDARIVEGTMAKTTFTMDTKSSKLYSRIVLRDPLLLETDFVLQPILLRSVFSCGDKNLYFTQKGKHPYRFSITTHKGGLVANNAVRTGWEHNSPLIVMKGQSGSGSLADSKSFLQVSQPNVIVSILKKAEDGNGVIVRCYETDGKNTTISVKGPEEIRKAARVSIIEEQLNNSSLPIEENIVKEVSVGKFAIETLRLNYK